MSEHRLMSHDAATNSKHQPRERRNWGSKRCSIFSSLSPSFAYDKIYSAFVETPVEMRMGMRVEPHSKLKMSEDELITINAKGKNRMSSHEKKLSDAEINDLTTYIRQLAKGK